MVSLLRQGWSVYSGQLWSVSPVSPIDFDYRDYLNNPNDTNLNLIPAPRYGEFGWDVFVNGGLYLQGIPDHSDGSPFSLGLTDLAGQQGLIQQLLNQGYDIVLVDFARGADYVQKNAFALIKVIQEINALKITKDENVIVGASMGGLTTRYALAYMEKNNMKHCTRLWCSFDSPHLGANIPVGLQFALLFFANSDNTAQENIKRLNLPGAKQMLIRHISRRFNGMREIETNAQCFRTNLINALNEIGWPNQLRKIALVNGNVSALGNGIGNGTTLMEWSHTATMKVSGKTLYSFDAAACNIYAQGRTDNIVFYGLITQPNPKISMGFCAGTGGITTNVVPNGPITITASIPGLGPCAIVQINRFGKSEKWTCGGANCPNIDGAPGGLHDGVKSMYEGIKKTAIKNRLTPPNPNYIGLISFIPSISAVNVFNTTNYKYDILTNIDYSNGNAGQSPFESYKGPELLWPNEGHVYLTKNNQMGSGYKGNVEYINQQLALNYDGSTPDLPNILGLTYNHGLKAQGSLKTKTINANGSYYINKQGSIGWQTPNDPSSVNSSTLSVRTINNCGENSLVTVNSGGQFIVGDAGPTPINNKGVVSFTRGSSLVLNDGALFIIHKGSKVIIESGASIHINRGAIIQIAETGVLEIRGPLHLGDNAVLSINEVPNQGKGYLKFVSNESINSPSTQIIPGVNSKIILAGNTSGTNTTKVLEIGGDGGLHLQQYIHPYDFEVIDGTIELGMYNFIKSSNNFKLQNVIVKPAGISSPLGIILDEDFYATTRIDPIISINQCKFYYCNTGLSITRVYTNPSLSLSNNEFYHCSSGLSTSGVTMSVSNTSFISCAKGWEIGNPIGEMIGDELWTSNCGIGISQSLGNPSTLLLNKLHSTNDEIGVATSSGTLKVKCMHAYNNSIAAIHSTNTHVILNGADAGFNQFLYSHDIGIVLHSQSLLSIKDGNNYFSNSPVYSTYSALAEGGHNPANLGCAQEVFSPDPSGQYMEATDISGNYILGPQIYYKRLCGTVYQYGAFYNNNASSSTFIATQINNACLPAIVNSGGGGYSKKGSDDEDKPNKVIDTFSPTATIESMNIYPNPAQQELTIELGNIANKEVFLYDSYGRLIYHEIPTNTLTKVNTFNFKAGVYLLHITGTKLDKRLKITITK